MVRSYRDKKTQSETIAGVISDIDTSQLAHNSNDISIRDIAESTDFDNRKAINSDKNVDSKTAYSASTQADGSPTQFSECDRFCKNHSIPESVKVTGQKSTQ